MCTSDGFASLKNPDWMLRKAEGTVCADTLRHTAARPLQRPSPLTHPRSTELPEWVMPCLAFHGDQNSVFTSAWWVPYPLSHHPVTPPPGMLLTDCFYSPKIMRFIPGPDLGIKRPSWSPICPCGEDCTAIRIGKQPAPQSFAGVLTHYPRCDPNRQHIQNIKIKMEPKEYETIKRGEEKGRRDGNTLCFDDWPEIPQEEAWWLKRLQLHSFLPSVSSQRSGQMSNLLMIHSSSLGTKVWSSVCS